MTESDADTSYGDGLSDLSIVPVLYYTLDNISFYYYLMTMKFAILLSLYEPYYRGPSGRRIIKNRNVTPSPELRVRLV